MATGVTVWGTSLAGATTTVLVIAGFFFFSEPFFGTTFPALPFGGAVLTTFFTVTFFPLGEVVVTGLAATFFPFGDDIAAFAIDFFGAIFFLVSFFFVVAILTSSN